jgi:hypothetical protein
MLVGELDVSTSSPSAATSSRTSRSASPRARGGRGGGGCVLRCGAGRALSLSVNHQHTDPLNEFLNCI